MILTLVLTGATGGIGSGSWALQVPDVVRDEGEVAGARAVHGVMTLERSVLLADDGLVETLVALRRGQPECTELRGARMVTERFQHVLVDPELAPAVAGSVGPDSAPVTLYRCTAGDASATLALGRGLDVPEDWSGFEYRLSLEVDLVVGEGTERVHVIGVPIEDAARRVTAISEALAQHPSALFADAGSFVDGSSAVRDGALSLHRPAGFDVLRRLDPAALAPGRNELVAGAVSFLEEAGDLPYIATNWDADEGAPWLPPVRIVDVGGLRVAFVAAIDPSIASPQLGAEGVRLTDPAAALRAAVPELDAHVVVALVSGSEAVVDQVQAVPGIDVVVGERGPRIERLERAELTLRPALTSTGPAPITVPLDGVATVSVEVEDGEPASATLRFTRLDADVAPDPEVLARVNAVRDESYPGKDAPLLPELGDAAWDKLVCEAVLEATGAHVALLPALPEGLEVPGPLTELLVADRLAVLDRLELHEVGGELLPRLLDKAFGIVPTACGAPLGDKSPLVGGRAIDPQRLYLVATTDRLMGSSAVQAVVSEARSSRVLDRPVVHDPGLTLRAAVLQVLRRYRDEDSDIDVVDELTSRTEADLQPLWLARVARASVGASAFQGVEDEAYAGVPETLATSPSAVTLTTDLDLALEYSSRRFAWDVRHRLLYTRLDTDAERTEPADDLRLSTSATLPGVKIPLVARWVPYTELLLDSEVTPVEANPRQADLSLTVGLSTSAGALSRLRLGGFLLRDLSVPEKAYEPGARLEAATTVVVGPGLSWKTALDGFLFADSPDQDASDLRFKLLADTRLDLPLARWLSTAPYAQVFAFQGRVPATDTPAASWTVGAALDLSGAFRL